MLRLVPGSPGAMLTLKAACPWSSVWGWLALSGPARAKGSGHGRRELCFPKGWMLGAGCLGLDARGLLRTGSASVSWRRAAVPGGCSVLQKRFCWLWLALFFLAMAPKAK